MTILGYNVWGAATMGMKIPIQVIDIYWIKIITAMGHTPIEIHPSHLLPICPPTRFAHWDYCTQAIVRENQRPTTAVEIVPRDLQANFPSFLWYKLSVS